MNGAVVAVFICPVAGEPMKRVTVVDAIAGVGLAGDRYAAGAGSYNRGRHGKRQVTLINALFFEGTPFDYADSRRNIVVRGIELMWLIGREFQIGGARFRGDKYCDPCDRPSTLSGNAHSFREAFLDRGGLIAEVVTDGVIGVGSVVVPPPRGY